MRGSIGDMEGPVTIQGDRVVLRPFRPEELDAWVASRSASAGDPTVNPAGPPDPERLRERVERSGRMRGGWIDLAIQVDGRLAGEIGTYAEPGVTPVPGTFFIGIGLFDPADRGHGVGTEAVRLLCDWLFSAAAAVRVESSTAVTNTAMRRVFERLGFVHEGVEVRWDVEWARYGLSHQGWLSSGGAGRS